MLCLNVNAIHGLWVSFGRNEKYASIHSGMSGGVSSTRSRASVLFLRYLRDERRVTVPLDEDRWQLDFTVLYAAAFRFKGPDATKDEYQHMFS